MHRAGSSDFVKLIYYSHVNEDSRVERELYAQRPLRQLYGIVGSGERLIALLDHPSLERVHAIDTNQDALYLLELKLTALKSLSIDAYLGFSGFCHDKPDQRIDIYQTVRTGLSEAARHYWDARVADLTVGLLYLGHFERFLARIRPFLTIFLGRGFFTRFDPAVAIVSEFPQRRWSLLKRFFAHSLTFRLAGNRDAAFVASDARVSLIPEALQRTIDNSLTSRSFMFHLIFFGHLCNMPAEDLPGSLQCNVLQRVRTRLRNGDIEVSFHCEDVLEYCGRVLTSESEPGFFSLSDLLSFVDFGYLKTFLTSLPRISSGKHRVVFRTFLRNTLTTDQKNWLYAFAPRFDEHSSREMTSMYHVFSIDC